MITYVSGSLVGEPPRKGPVMIDGPDGPIVADVAPDLGPLEADTRVLVARVHVDVGIDRHELGVLLGPWSADAPDPAGPLGLASTPVVVLPDPVWGDVAIAGAIRAGGQPTWIRVPADGPSLGMQLLVAVTYGADVVIVDGGGGAELRLGRALGGRPLPVLPLPDVEAIRSLFAGCELDVHVPVPSTDEPARARIQGVLAPLELESLHHLVEVDPAPAFEQAGLDMGRASFEALAAGAAGVLAGRLASSNRRWREQLEA